MIHIRTQDSKIQVFHDDLLLATFSSMSAAVEYANRTAKHFGLTQSQQSNSSQ